MKFERARTSQVPQNKYELDNQQFLTFRNNPVTQNTGRTVYSQQFDYKSLDRYEKPEENLAHNFNFRKNIKNMRSQDKYKQLKEEALLFQPTEENNESQFVSSSQRSQQLKIKFSKMVKSLKRQQKRQHLLRKQISILVNETDEFSQTQSKLQSDISQLALILKDNQKNINFMNRKLDNYKHKEKQLHKQIQYLQNTIQEQIVDERINIHSTKQYQQQLTDGIQQLERYSDTITKKILFFTEQIKRMEEGLDDMDDIHEGLINALSK